MTPEQILLEPEVMDLTKISSTFPKLPDPNIKRENILDTVLAIFEGGCGAVLVEGDDGVGKTTLLAQFALRCPNQAISLFIRPDNRHTYKQNFVLYEICNQLKWITSGDETSAAETLTDSSASILLADVRRKARRNGKPFYFVIDGLDEIPDDEFPHAVDAIFSLLPWNEDHFRFLLSVASHSKLRMPRTVASKALPLVTFSQTETVTFFGGSGLQDVDIVDLHQLCRGVPGRLASVRRQLNSGGNPAQMLQQSSLSLQGLLKMEWDRRDPEDESQQRLLALLAFDNRTHTVDTLADLALMTPEAVHATLNPLSFIEMKTGNNDVAFVTLSMRRYAVEALRAYRQKAYQMIVDALLKNPDSLQSIESLPQYLQVLGKHEQVVEYLSPELLSTVIATSKSLLPVRQKANMGLVCAESSHHDAAMLRFALAESAVRDLASASLSDVEIEACYAVGQRRKAAALAQSPTTKEDRLELLSALAKISCNEGEPLGEELQKQITALASQVDLSELGDRVLNIASNLLCPMPNLAAEMIDKATALPGKESNRDWAFMQLSLDADKAKTLSGTGDSIADRLRSHITDPDAREMSSAVSLAVRLSTANAILDQVNTMESVPYRINLLRVWCVLHKSSSDALAVVKHALQLVMQTTEFTPSASVLLDIARPLPELPDSIERTSVISEFDAQSGIADRLGPTEDYVRLQLLLADASSRCDTRAGADRLADLYNYIEKIQDLTTRCACLAHFASLLSNTCSNKNSEAHIRLCDKSISALDEAVLSALDGCYDHSRVLGGIIRAYADSCPRRVCEYIEMMNTEERRDAAYRLASSVLLQGDKLQDNIDELKVFIAKIISPYVKANAVLEAAQIVSRGKISVSVSATLVKFLWSEVAQVRSAVNRAEIYSRLSCLTNIPNEDASSQIAADKAIHEAKQSWNCIDDATQQLDVAFKIAKIMAASKQTEAQGYLALASKVRETSPTAPVASSELYWRCVHLASRALGIVLRRRSDMDSDLTKLRSLIMRLPSEGERAAIWADVACRLEAGNRHDLSRRIVEEEVKPLLLKLPDVNDVWRDNIIALCSPALFIAHAQSTITLLETVDSSCKDICCQQIANFILTKIPPLDGVSEVHGRSTATFNDLVDVCMVLDQMENDVRAYAVIEQIADKMTGKQNTDKYTAGQRETIALKIEHIVKCKFPWPRGIRHTGYQIAGKAQALRIRRANWPAFEELRNRARAEVNNMADLSCVLIIIASSVPHKYLGPITELYEEALKAIEKIPDIQERVERCEMVAHAATDGVPAIARKAITRAFDFVWTIKGERSLTQMLRGLVDEAYKIDPKIAEALAAKADPDPARKREREEINERLGVLKLKSGMIEASRDGGDVTSLGTKKLDEVAEAARLNLRSLLENRLSPLDMSQIRQLFRLGASGSLAEAHWLFSFAVESVARKYADTDQAMTLGSQIFDACIINGELVARMIERNTVQSQSVVGKYDLDTSNGSSIILGPNDRTEVERSIRSWLRDNVCDYIKIIDPYFSPEELYVLKWILDEGLHCDATILTSRKSLLDAKVVEPFSETFIQQWRNHVSDQRPPPTEIVIAGMQDSGELKSGELSIHSRWWLTNGAGLRLDSSINYLGMFKLSEISYLTASETKEREKVIDPYLRHEVRMLNGQRVRYESFSLDLW